jgi:immunity protein 10 of polymorphic toxin system
LGVKVTIENLAAAEVTMMDDGECLTVAFRDGNRKERYLLVQRAKVPSAQDRTLGMSTYYIERNDQRYSCYGGMATLELHPDAVAIELNEQGASRLQAKRLHVHFSVDPHKFQELRKTLRQVLYDTDCLVEIDAQPGAPGDAR